MSLGFNSADPIFSASLPSALINSASKDLKLDKFAYLTADIKVKVAIQSQAMITCMFYLCYMPLEDYLPVIAQVRSKHFTQITSLPGVMFNLTSTNTAEITIPYSSFFEKWPLYTGMDASNQNVRDWAHVYLYALAPLRSAGSPNITINAWSWFDKDSLKVEGPTSLSIVDGVQYADSIHTPLINDVKIKRKRHLHNQINLGETSKVLSSTSVGKKLMSNIVKPIVKVTPKWVADTLSGAASMLGFSAPVSTDPIHSYVNIPAKGFTNSTKIDNSVVLGGTADNAVDPRCAQYNDKDELALDYLCNIPAVIGLEYWKASSGLLLKYPVNFRGRIVSAFGGTAMVCTPGEFAMMLFKKNRGTIVFQIDIAKTAFHTGRIEIVYVPDDFTGDSPPDETDNCFRQIVDLSETSRVEFEIPFLNYSLFLNSTSDDSNCGHVWIRNLTNLAYSESTVSDTVDIIVSKYIKNPAVAQPNPLASSIVLPPQPETTTFQMEYPNDAGTISYWRSDQDNAVNDVDYFTPIELNPGVGMNVAVKGAVTTLVKPPAAATGNIHVNFYYNSSGASLAQVGTYTTDHSGRKTFTTDIQSIDATTDAVVSHDWVVADTAFAQCYGRPTHLVDRVRGRYQINLGVETENKKMSVFPGGDSPSKNIDALQAAGGENILTLRSLLHRSTIFSEQETISPDASYHLVDPRSNLVNVSTICLITSAFRAVSGGINYKIFSYTPTGTVTSQIDYPIPNQASRTALRHTTFNYLNPVHEVSIPYYSRYRRIPVGFDTNQADPMAPGLPTVHLRVSEETKVDVYMAGKDDYNCQMFVCAPLFTTND